MLPELQSLRLRRGFTIDGRQFVSPDFPGTEFESAALERVPRVLFVLPENWPTVPAPNCNAHAERFVARSKRNAGIAGSRSVNVIFGERSPTSWRTTMANETTKDLITSGSILHDSRIPAGPFAVPARQGLLSYYYRAAA